MLVGTRGKQHRPFAYNDMYEMDLESYYTTGTANYSFQAENAITSGIAKVTRTEACTPNCMS